MNVEIITIHSMNYGNRLQNYALQAYLEKQGISVRTSFGHKKKYILARKLRDALLHFRRKTDKDLFLFFDTKINWKPLSQDPYCHDESIDYYFAGSDQIWNPHFSSCRDDKFLTFVPPYKRIAYAASIGVDELPESCKDLFRQRFLGFNRISVREQTAQKIVADLCGLDVPVLPDPTLLLNSDEWDAATKTSVLNIRKPFVVKYFLGIRNPEYEVYIEDYAKKHNCRIIDITKHESCGISGIGPDEFVQLFKNCEAAFVDSFHGTVFSIIFRKYFLSFARPSEEGFGNMNSRFETLLGALDLRNHYVQSPEHLLNLKIETDYDAVHKKIQLQRDLANQYFQDIFRS